MANKLLRVFPILLEARSDHNYEGSEYVKYLANKIHCLRKKLGITQKGGKIKESSDFSYYEILLFNADRALHQFFLLKPVNRKHAIRRLKRAIMIADALCSFVSSNAPENLKETFVFETQTYASFLHGYLCYEKSQLESAKLFFCETRIGLQVVRLKLDAPDYMKRFLGDLQSNLDNDLRYIVQKLDEADAENTLDYISLKGTPVSSPVLEFARKHCPDMIASQSQQDHELASVRTIQWRNNTVSVHNFDILMALFRVQDAERGLADGDELHDERTLSAWANAETIAKRVLDSTSIEDDEKAFQEVSICYTYIAFHHVLQRMQRDMKLLKTTDDGHYSSQYRTLQGVYDALIKNTEQAKTLPGISRDVSMSIQLDAQIAIFKCKRCQVIADSYQQVNKAVSLGMCVRALEHLEQVQDLLRELDEEPQAIAFNVVAEYKKDKETLEERVLQLQSLATVEAFSRRNTQLSVTESMNTAYTFQATEDNQSPINVTNSSVRPIPMKPVFFDLAVAYLGNQKAFHGPESSKKEQQASKQPAEAPKSKGFFRSFLGRLVSQ